ncbi:AraC family transcriptional regulator [Enterococcus diestrammenae]|uniref:AraC family transcriptional regulator n=1 Tax=Enterococcus diestrammenae TaxID=1155073 RepID=UPI00195B9E10
MKKSQILSLVIPSFPTFIEGNLTYYSAGQQHPNRNGLPYFDLLFVTKGCLFITEDGIEYEVHTNEMLILNPNSHHYSTYPCKDSTRFYWIHFYYDGNWVVNDSPTNLSSDVFMPNLHYHNEDYTLHLNKFQKLADSKFIFALLDRLLLGTKGEKKAIVFWDNQKRFTQLLKALEEQSHAKTASTELAENIELYLKQNFSKEINNQQLSENFHFHENYIIRCMKQVFNMTPLEYLATYRLEKAASFLIKTNLSMTDIATKCGFQSSAYFSLCFKKKFHVSPLNYRKNHSN